MLEKEKNELVFNFSDGDKQLYQKIFETADDAIFITNAYNGLIVGANKSAETLTGRTKKELAGMLHDELYSVNEFNENHNGFNASIINNKNKYHNLTVVHKSGSGIAVEITSGGVYKAAGDDLHILIMRKSSERKLLEENLRKKEEWYKAFFSATKAVILVIDPDSLKIVDANTAALDFYGYSKDDLCSLLISDINTLSEETIVEKVSKAKGVVQNNFSFKHRLADGSVKDVEVCSGPIEVNGRVLLYSIVHDVSERLKMEHELADSKERYSLAQRLNGIGTWDCNLEDGVVFWSEEMLDVFHTTEASFSGTMESFSSFVLPEDKIDFRDAFQECIEKNSELNIEYRITGGDGNIYWVQCLGNMVVDKKGNASRILGIAQDITRRKELESQLKHALKMEAIGQLAGGVAHDFNNQLSGIMGYGELLSRRLEDDSLKKYADFIITGAKRASDLTQKLLTFSRKSQYNMRIINLHDIISEVVEILKHSLDKKIEIQESLTASPSTILGDSSQVQSAVLNLALNAKDAMSDGGKVSFLTENVTVDSELYDIENSLIGPGEYIKLSVADTGLGISKDVQSRIFEPFFTTKDSGKGTGMGLAAVYGTVKQHRGKIILNSDVGKGSCFSIYFPACSDVIQVSPDKSSDVGVSRKISVLLVDDEEVIRNMLTEILDIYGCAVHSEENGVNGSMYYAEHHKEIDLVILDMVMPHMSGKECFERMKITNPEVKVILASGYSMENDAQILLEKGACGFIQKPFQQADILNAISKIFN